MHHSTEAIEERMGKTKAAPEFFKKLGEKLKNYPKYQQADTFFGCSLASSRSSLLNLNEGVRFSMESMASTRNSQPNSVKHFPTTKFKEDREEKKTMERYEERQQKVNDEKREKVQREEKSYREYFVPTNNKPNSTSMMGFVHCSQEQDVISENLNEGCRPVQSESDLTKQSTTPAINAISPTVMVAKVKSLSDVNDGIQTDFKLDSGNMLSILKLKNKPDSIIYRLQNADGCKIYLEKTDTRAVLISTDSNGKYLHICCNY